MRFVKVIISVLLSFAAVSAVAAESYEKLRADYDMVMKVSTASRSTYTSLGDRFHRVYASSPTAVNADNALFYAGKLYKTSYEKHGQQADMDTAIKYLGIVHSNYTSNAAAEALLESAELFIQKRDLPSAQHMLKKVKTRFAGSIHELAADSMLSDLEKMNKRGGETYANTYTIPSVVVNEALNNQAALNSASNTPEKVVTIEPPSGSEYENGIGEVVEMPEPTGTTVIKDIRYFSSGDYTRVVIDLSQNAKYEQRWLNEDPSIKMPPRLFLDIDDSTVGNVPQKTDIQDGFVTSVRWAYNKPGVTRVVLDSEGIEEFTIFQMSNPARIVIDVSGEGKLTTASKNVGTQPTTPSTLETIPIEPDKFNTQPGTNAANTLASTIGLKIRTIVIDPGHGGKDPGCVYAGMKEKDIVLEISKHLAAELKKNKDITVHLTRDKDVYLPLEARTAFANQKKADLFISVHINATKNGVARGVETYVLNVTNDKSALEVAAFENQATTKSMSDLQGILADIMRNSKLEESLRAAGLAQKGIADHLKLPAKQNRGVKQAPFYVLVGAQMPAILIEAGYLSNKEDAANLKKSDYRKKVAQGMANGINGYINLYNKK